MKSIAQRLNMNRSNDFLDEIYVRTFQHTVSNHLFNFMAGALTTKIPYFKCRVKPDGSLT